MSSAMAHLILFLSLSSPAFAAGVPIRPGATLAATTNSAKQDNRQDGVPFVAATIDVATVEIPVRKPSQTAKDSR
jgi:hypothetical protein